VIVVLRAEQNVPILGVRARAPAHPKVSARSDPSGDRDPKVYPLAGLLAA
jgi:hypothetical protein